MRKYHANKTWQRQLTLHKAVLLGLLLANLAYLTRDFVGWLLTLGFFLLVPGYLLLGTITDSVKSRWEALNLSLGLSILVLIMSGLLLNALHFFGLNRPLTTWNVFIALDIVTLGLLQLSKKKALGGIRLQSWVFRPMRTTILLALTALPVLATGGAIRLNNGASNILIMILFAMIVFLFVALLSQKALQPLYPFAVIMMGLSILLTISLRGWLVSGHDIQREFYVFQLASRAGYWSIARFRNPYNACLSITLLPTILAKITTVAAPNIYKVVFQIIFACGVSSVYLFVKRLSNARYALIGSLVFMSFTTFLNSMPFLNRQEIAFIFFSLLFLVAFMDLPRRPKTILTSLMLAGLIVSHYSSSYVMLGILILSWGYYQLFRRLLHVPDKKSGFALPLLRWPIIFAALLLTFLWNTQITATTGGLQHTLTRAVHEMFDRSAIQSSSTGYSLLSPSTPSPPSILAKYAGSQTDEIQYVALSDLPITKFGRLTGRFVNVETLNAGLRSFSARILQILLLIGVTVIFARLRRTATRRDIYFLAAALASITLLALQTILPQLSVDYGTQRFFQQALIVLVLPIVVATDLLLGYLGRLKFWLVSGFFVFLFLDLSGFIPQALGGYPAQLALNNSGQPYDLFYVHAGEELSFSWLTANLLHTGSVGMDYYAQERFDGFFNHASVSISPLPRPPSSSYLYQDFANMHYGLYGAFLDGDQIEYQDNTLSANRSLLYQNQDSRIYTGYDR